MAAPATNASSLISSLESLLQISQKHEAEKLRAEGELESKERLVADGRATEQALAARRHQVVESLHAVEDQFERQSTRIDLLSAALHPIQLQCAAARECVQRARDRISAAQRSEGGAVEQLQRSAARAQQLVAEIQQRLAELAEAKQALAREERAREELVLQLAQRKAEAAALEARASDLHGRVEAQRAEAAEAQRTEQAAAQSLAELEARRLALQDEASRLGRDMEESSATLRESEAANNQMLVEMREQCRQSFAAIFSERPNPFEQHSEPAAWAGALSDLAQHLERERADVAAAQQALRDAIAADASDEAALQARLQETNAAIEKKQAALQTLRCNLDPSNPSGLPAGVRAARAQHESLCAQRDEVSRMLVQTRENALATLHVRLAEVTARREAVRDALAAQRRRVEAARAHKALTSTRMEVRTAELKQAQESMHGAYAAANAELDRQKGIHARNCFKRNKLHEELTAQTQAKLKVARELAEVVAKLDATRASAADAERQLQSKKAAAAEARAALSEQQAALEQLESAAAALAECHRRDVEALQRKHEAALAQLQARPSSPPPRVLAEKQREWQRAFREVNRAHDEQMAELERQLSEAGRAVAKAKA